MLSWKALYIAYHVITLAAVGIVIAVDHLRHEARRHAAALRIRSTTAKHLLRGPLNPRPGPARVSQNTYSPSSLGWRQVTRDSRRRPKSFRRGRSSPEA